MTGIASGTVLNLDMKEAANVVKEENARVAEMIGTNKALEMGRADSAKNNAPFNYADTIKRFVSDL